MGFTKSSCEEFVDVLASKAPVPGGGGASALVGAIGMALGNMVGSLTVGKKKYADVEADIIALKEKATALQADFLRLVEADAEAFEPLAKAYGMPRETEEEKAEKAKSDADAQISEMKFDYALSAALTGAKARNSKAVKALLDMDGLKLNDGKIIGLDEQLSQIKEENGFLFESDEPAPTIVKGTNGGSGGIGGKKPSEMTYSELCDYMEQNPGAEI